MDINSESYYQIKTALEISSENEDQFDEEAMLIQIERRVCLLYTSDAADDSLRVDLGGRRII